MTNQARTKRKWNHVEIDDQVKKLLLDGIRKSGTRKKLAETMGYSTPTNIIWQFMTAPKHKKFILRSRLARLKDFLSTDNH